MILVLYMFSIPSLSRHEKRCRILARLFGFFNALENPECNIFYLFPKSANKLSQNVLGDTALYITSRGLDKKDANLALYLREREIKHKLFILGYIWITLRKESNDAYTMEDG